MAVSAISQIVRENYVLSLGTFVYGGKPYVLWTTPQWISGVRSLWWRAHDGSDTTEVQAAFNAQFLFATGIARPDGRLLVVYTETENNESRIISTVLDIATGAVVAAPARVALAAQTPTLVHLPGSSSMRFVVVYVRRSTGAVYLKETLDGGASWGDERPVLNNRVLTTESVVAVPFDQTHFTVMQVGYDARPLREIGYITRTRPLASIVKHPTLAGRVFVAEPSWLDTTYFTDHARGALRLSRDGATLYWIDGARLGTTDSINEVALYDVSGSVPTYVNSMHNSNADGSLGDNFVSYTVSPFDIGPAVDVFGSATSVAVDMDLSSSYAYVAGTKEVAPTAGGGSLEVVRLSDRVRAAVVSASSTVFCTAVGVANPDGATPLALVGTVESSVPHLRIYQESGLFPSLLSSHQMPAKVSKIAAVMSSASSGLLYVSMSDRLNVYVLRDLASPLRLSMSIPSLTRGDFRQIAITTQGNIVAAMGNGGVGVFSPSGETLAQRLCSGIRAAEWYMNRAVSLNELVMPSKTSPYALQGKHFICTTAGTTGVTEPAWLPSGIIQDGSAAWQEVGLRECVVSGVAVDETLHRIYAVGVLGGATGTGGRLFILDAKELV